MKEYFRKPYMTQGIAKHSDYMKAIPQRAIDVQGQIAPNINFKKPYAYQPNTAQMIHYYANELHYFGGDPVPPLNDPSLLPHNPQPVVEEPAVQVLPTTFNPGDKSVKIALSDGNLTWTRDATIQPGCVRTYASNNKGKWYFEITLNPVDAATFAGCGIATSSYPMSGIVDSSVEGYIARISTSYVEVGYNGVWTTISASGGLVTIMMAVDLDVGNIWFGKNGTWYNSGNPYVGTNPTFSGISGTFFVLGGFQNNSLIGAGEGTAIFGSSPFKYTQPNGYNKGFFQEG